MTPGSWHLSVFRFQHPSAGVGSGAASPQQCARLPLISGGLKIQAGRPLPGCQAGEDSAAVAVPLQQVSNHLEGCDSRLPGAGLGQERQAHSALLSGSQGSMLLLVGGACHE